MCVRVLRLRGGGEAGPGSRLGLSFRQREADRSELHTPADPCPALHLRGRRLEGLLLVERARSWKSRGERFFLIVIVVVVIVVKEADAQLGAGVCKWVAGAAVVVPVARV